MAIRHIKRYVTTNGQSFDTLERALFTERCDNLYALRPPSTEITNFDWLVKNAEAVIAALTVEIKDE